MPTVGRERVTTGFPGDVAVMSPPAARRGQVLVAEDDVRLGRPLAQSLTKADWEVVVVHDGLAAFDRGLVGDEDGPLNLLLLDWMLPGRDG